MGVVVVGMGVVAAAEVGFLAVVVVTSYKLQVTSSKLQNTSNMLQNTSYKLHITSYLAIVVVPQEVMTQ